MLDLERVAQEFAFLRDRIKETSKCLDTEAYSEAAFLLGGLHMICNNHAITISQLIPPKQDQSIAQEVEKNESST